ncbi:hypothetical protein KIW84_035454 [Lathyrus oleraceus]|uniref:Uncharacterized protein n=1 Tax=Pisum sativum TaxID=3888 RepID=A0A9D4Y3P3_PEA|nr:hypothetical protein KIW84_035454 [Pisum sativum]
MKKDNEQKVVAGIPQFLPQEQRLLPHQRPAQSSQKLKQKQINQRNEDQEGRLVRRRGADGRIPVRTLDRGASSSAAAAEPTGYPGGPYDTSLLVKYEHHVARHIWFGEERGPKKELKVAGHGLKLNSRVPLALPPQMESWIGLKNETDSRRNGALKRKNGIEAMNSLTQVLDVAE